MTKGATVVNSSTITIYCELSSIIQMVVSGELDEISPECTVLGTPVRRSDLRDHRRRRPRMLSTRPRCRGPGSVAPGTAWP